MIKFPPNSIGLTQYACWDTDLSSGKTLEGQLKDNGVTYESLDIPEIFGMAGNARLIHYHSKSTGLPVTVLLVPSSSIDCGMEEYFTFVGMDRMGAGKVNWVECYQEAKELVNRAN